MLMRWTDLEAGDKIEITTKIKKQFGKEYWFRRDWHNKVFEVESVTLCNESELIISCKEKEQFYLKADGTFHDIQFFRIVELVGDRE